MALQETLLYGDEKDDCAIAELLHSLPNYDLYQCPRKNRKGGGVCLLLKKGFKAVTNRTEHFKSFEMLDITISRYSTNLRLLNKYRPPRSDKNKTTPTMFLEDFGTLLEVIVPMPEQVFLVGDSNWHVDETSDRSARNFLQFFDAAGLQQSVNTITHDKGHTLDLVISRLDSSLVSDVNVIGGLPSDHKAVTY